jgi:hypothetical protein
MREAQHGGVAELAQSVYVHERQAGLTVWEGVIHTFDVSSSPAHKRVYAWCNGHEDGTIRYFAVSHAGAAMGPVEALRMTIMSEAGEYTPDTHRSWLAA